MITDTVHANPLSGSSTKVRQDAVCGYLARTQSREAAGASKSATCAVPSLSMAAVQGKESTSSASTGTKDLQLLNSSSNAVVSNRGSSKWQKVAVEVTFDLRDQRNGAPCSEAAGNGGDRHSFGVSAHRFYGSRILVFSRLLGF